MTVPTEDYDGYTTRADADIVELRQVDPIPVYIAKSEKRQAAHFGALSSVTVPVAGIGQPIQLLQRRLTRNKAVIYNPQQVPGISLAVVGAPVAAPAAFTTLATLTGIVVGQIYEVTVTVTTSGTTGAPEIDNAFLGGGPANIQIATVAGGSVTVTYQLKASTTTFLVESRANAATAGSTYIANITATLASDSNPVILSQNLGMISSLVPNGYTLDSGNDLKWESQQPLYAIVPVGGIAQVISILDESWETSDGNQ